MGNINWLNGVEINNENLCLEVEKLFNNGYKTKDIFNDLEKQCDCLWSSDQIKNRYSYYKKRNPKEEKNIDYKGKILELFEFANKEASERGIRKYKFYSKKFELTFYYIVNSNDWRNPKGEKIFRKTMFLNGHSITASGIRLLLELLAKSNDEIINKRRVPKTNKAVTRIKDWQRRSKIYLYSKLIKEETLPTIYEEKPIDSTNDSEENNSENLFIQKVGDEMVLRIKIPDGRNVITSIIKDVTTFKESSVLLLKTLDNNDLPKILKTQGELDAFETVLELLKESL